MIKSIYTFLILFSNNFLFANIIQSDTNSLLNDSTILIKKIEFSHISGALELKDVLTSKSYKIIIDSNCNLELTRPGKCPSSSIYNCSYYGKITKKELNKINLILSRNICLFKNLYSLDADDVGYDIIKIYYNNNKEFEIIDESHENIELIKLKKKIIKIKDKVSWAVNKNL